MKTEQESASDMICTHQFNWCRARLLHALAGAHEQGVLHEVLDELLSDTDDDHREAATYSIKSFLRSGWTLDAGNLPLASAHYPYPVACGTKEEAK
jgi:hypothetical protein